MIQVKVNDRNGFTTSVLPHTGGNYPVWFNDTKNVEFIKSKDVVLI